MFTVVGKVHRFADTYAQYIRYRAVKDNRDAPVVLVRIGPEVQRGTTDTRDVPGAPSPRFLQASCDQLALGFQRPLRLTKSETVFGYGGNGTWKPCVISSRRSIFQIGSHSIYYTSYLEPLLYIYV